MIKVALDAMGGDYAPSVCIEGAVNVRFRLKSSLLCFAVSTALIMPKVSIVTPPADKNRNI